MTEPFSEPYLILHKVRGEPAYDIAERAMFGATEGWIVATSGHRAYPLRYWPLSDFAIDVNKGALDFRNLPDHYSCNDRFKSAPSTRSILEDLGLI